MKNLLGSFSSIEFIATGVEFLNEDEMLQIRGGAEERPKSRPRELFDEELPK